MGNKVTPCCPAIMTLRTIKTVWSLDKLMFVVSGAAGLIISPTIGVLANGQLFVL